MRSRAVRTALAMSLALAAGSCQVPTNREPQHIADEDVRYGLLETTTTTTTTTVAAPIEVKRYIHLVETDADGSRLVRVERSFEAGASNEASVLVRLMADQGTEAENADGITSAIPDGAEFLDLAFNEDGTIATVQISGIFDELQGEQIRLALAQLVFTVTDPDFDDSVNSVRFRNASGDIVDALIDGNESATIVRRSDYRSVAPS